MRLLLPTKLVSWRILHEEVSKARVIPGSSDAQKLGVTLNKHTELSAVLRRPEVNSAAFAQLYPDIEANLLEQVMIETKYAGYISRQEDEIAKIRRHEGMSIPTNMSYKGIDGLSNELQQKLEHNQPTTLARAASIPGMTPAALSILLIHAKKAAAS